MANHKWHLYLENQSSILRKLVPSEDNHKISAFSPKKTCFWPIALSLGLALIPHQVQAQAQVRIQKTTREAFAEALTIKFEPPPEKDKPTNTVGGGTRGWGGEGGQGRQGG
ncbi:MAG: hypothetical protein F6K47_20660 [Symploca sp. SIO2E6]|nr:hypothetical protein [Symploca sp. SIO2E6]